jgi:hypothetical protein
VLIIPSNFHHFVVCVAPEIPILAGIDAYSLPGFGARGSFAFISTMMKETTSSTEALLVVFIVKVTGTFNLIPVYYEVKELGSLSQGTTITVISCIWKQNIFGGRVL